MKTKLLLIAFIFIYAAFNTVKANSIITIRCGGYKISKKGKIYIENESSQIISNAQIWMFLSLNDSFLMPKNRLKEIDVTDSNAFNIWSDYNYKRNVGVLYQPIKKFLLIRVIGYADIVITNLKFKFENRFPELHITMYPKKYLTKGNLITIIEKYVVEKPLLVMDSVRIGINDYNESMRSNSTVAEAQRTASFIVKTYPNPVKDKLIIEFKDDITKAYTAKLMDINGRLINAIQLDAKNNNLNMEWEVAGIYIIQIFDPEGTMIYALKFMKT